VVRLSQFLANNEAYRLKEHLNTKPRVYYIPGHGQNVGRSPYETGRVPTEWPWVETVEGSEVWSR
jgi:lipoprotein-anchoring transpeptidase ErfK/SrfK